MLWDNCGNYFIGWAVRKCCFIVTNYVEGYISNTVISSNCFSVLTFNFPKREHQTKCLKMLVNISIRWDICINPTIKYTYLNNPNSNAELFASLPQLLQVCWEINYGIK